MKGKSKLPLSIIIVNWNGKPWLEQLLPTLNTNKYDGIEILIVDNNSNDDSIAFVELHFPFIKIIKSNKNNGFAKGNNLGIRAASHEYILLINNDTWVEEDFFDEIYKLIDNLKYDLVGFRSVTYNKNGIVKEMNTLPCVDIFGHPYQHPGINWDKLFFIPGSSLLFTKSLYYETAGLDDAFFMYSEEVDWCWRLHLLGKKIMYYSRPVVHHYSGGSTIKKINPHKFYWRNVNNLQMLIKNYALFSLIIILPIYLILNIFEVIFFLLLKKGSVAKTYIFAWVDVAKRLPLILAKRKIIQSNRVVSDMVIFRKMYFGIAKIQHLSLEKSKLK